MQYVHRPDIILCLTKVTPHILSRDLQIYYSSILKFFLLLLPLLPMKSCSEPPKVESIFLIARLNVLLIQLYHIIFNIKTAVLYVGSLYPKCHLPTDFCMVIFSLLFQTKVNGTLSLTCQRGVLCSLLSSK